MFYILEKQLHKFGQFIKFSIVGALNTLVSLITFYFLIRLGVYYLLAINLAYGMGMLSGYTLHKIWVFDSEHSILKTVPKFIAINLTSLGLTNILLYICVMIFNLDKILAQIIITFIVLIISYFGNKIWTFRKEGTI